VRAPLLWLAGRSGSLFAAGLRSPLYRSFEAGDAELDGGPLPTDTTRLGAGRGPTDTDTESYARPTIYLVFLDAPTWG